MTPGWNSWDPIGVNRIMHPERDVEIIIATMDIVSGVVLDEYSYHVREERRAIAEGKKQLGEMMVGSEEERRLHKKHASAGVTDKPMGWIRKAGGRALDLSRGYLLLGHTLERGFWEADFACGAEQAAVRVSVPEPDSDLRFVIMVRAPWGRGCGVEACLEAGRIKARPPQGGASQLVFVDGRPEAACAGADHQALIEACVSGERAASAQGRAAALILPFASFEMQVAPEGAKRTKPVFADRPKTGLDGADLREAIEAVVGWNLCWDPVYNRLQLPVNKEWVAAGLRGMALHNCHFGERELAYAMGPAVFAWDSGFLALLTASLDPTWGQEVLKSAVAYNRKPDGSLSTCRMGRHQLDAMTNPPTLTWAAARLFERTRDTAFLDDVYPALRDWYFWMQRERDRNGDGLYEWGINPDFGSEWPVGMAGRLESGLDNSPMYYDVPVSEEHHTLAMNCIDLCSFQALAAESLTAMARALGRDDDATAFQQEYATLSIRINDRLWDEARGVYANRLWSGEFGVAISPTSFYPLLAGVATPERAARTIREWLRHPEHFGVEHPLPSMDAAHPDYNPDGNYWRGRIWGPMNYLVFHGLLRYDRKAAEWLARKSAEVLLPDWREHGRVYENYSAETGRGRARPDNPEAVCNCDFYVWGALLALMSEELGPAT